MQTLSQIRAEFLSYFSSKGHQVVESSSLIPHNDPTLLFTNAGMNQFKDLFLGLEKRQYSRATTSQKCVRAGGKHNDLENVGFTARHHTFFEMLGNFSFGDYFKKDAIHFAWEFVTKNLSLDKSRLYVSVYREDDEAALIWEKQEGVSRDRIYRFGEKDNFWSMGDTGPCGPCSEIFVDRGAKNGCGKASCSVGCDCDRFMEIWNLVFMQFERSVDGSLSPLPKPSIDTGMGLERLTSVIQDTKTNYDTDAFQVLIEKVSELSKIKYGKNGSSDTSMRVIADHCRAANFLIADGVLPSNEGRGYVLRRIMRRAIRHGRNLGFREPFFQQLTPVLIDLMGKAYPELNDKREYLQSTILLEEERFLRTLENGLQILEKEILFQSREGQKKTLSGSVAFQLYDTFGFPLDLTQVIAREKGFTVDDEKFTEKMLMQKERSRENWKGSGEAGVDQIYKKLQQDGLKSSFIGYNQLSSQGKILAIIEEGKEVKESSTGEFQIIIDKTSFYAESGGQVSDRGIISAKDFLAKVVDVQKPTPNCIVIFCQDAQGRLKVGDIVDQKNEIEIRKNTAKNHTATHLLHYFLRKNFGDHIKQAGSLVNAELLRFDFTHPKALTDEEILKIENQINSQIQEGSIVSAEEMEKEKAIAKGAMAFFGDKYGSHVRVISVGDYSIELCGGTHVYNTGEIQGFKIISESGVAAGVRRIIAVTGGEVIRLLQEKDRQLKSLMSLVKASAVTEVYPKVERLMQSEKELRRSVEAQAKKSASVDVDKWISTAKTIEGGRLVSAEIKLNEQDVPAKILREIVDVVRSKTTKTIVALGAFDTQKGQSFLLIAVTKDWPEKHKANEWIKKLAPLIEGTGGGKPDFAQAGGKVGNFNAVFSSLLNLLS